MYCSDRRDLRVHPCSQVSPVSTWLRCADAIGSWRSSSRRAPTWTHRWAWNCVQRCGGGLCFRPFTWSSSLSSLMPRGLGNSQFIVLALLYVVVHLDSSDQFDSSWNMNLITLELQSKAPEGIITSTSYHSRIHNSFQKKCCIVRRSVRTSVRDSVSVRTESTTSVWRPLWDEVTGSCKIHEAVTGVGAVKPGPEGWRCAGTFSGVPPLLPGLSYDHRKRSGTTAISDPQSY